MKPKSMKTILLAALMAPGALFAQTTATTTPVGYVTHTVAGNVANEPSGADTYISPVLVTAADFTGETSIPVTGAVATFASGVPLALNDAYIVEITAGANEGWWSRILSTSATTVTAQDEFPASLPAGTKLVVRKLPTLNSFLGENSLGLTGSDQVLLLDPVNQQVTVAIYVAGEWQNFVSEENIDNNVILPGTSIAVRRFGSTPLTVVSTGEVKVTKTQVDIFAQDNWLGQTLAAGGTLSQMNLVNTIDASDFVNFLNPDQTTDVFIKVGPEMQNFVTEANADGFIVGSGQGYVFRRPTATPTAIVIPAQIVAQ